MTRPMMPGIILTLALTIISLPAAAEDRPPRYDEDALCNRMANSNDGFSPEAMQKCLMTQNDALGEIRRVWRRTPDYIQRDCDRRARNDGDKDYVLLQKCIHDQTRQAPPDEVMPEVR